VGELVQALVYGLTVGSVYALVALGYTLVFSASRIVNFAQGASVVLGGYLAWWLYDVVFDASLALPVVLAGVVVLAGAAGAAVYAVTVAPLGRFDPRANVAWLVTTFAAAIVIQELVGRLLSDEGQRLPDLATSIMGWQGSVVEDVAITPNDVVLVTVTLLLVLGLERFQNRTRTGLAFRAVAQDRQAASLMGISPTKIVLMAFVVAGALAGLAGVLIAPRLGVRFTVALDLGVAGFVAAVIGGLGSARGAVLGGFAVGLVQGTVGVLIDRPDAWRPVAVFVLFVAVLAIRPSGLLGRKLEEKV
jgi:branched-chain amino acid transport system permease protein